MMCRYSGQRVLTFDKREYNFLGTCQYQLLGICEQGLDVIKVDVQTDAYNQSAQKVLVSINEQQMQLDSKNQESIKVDGIKRNMPFYPNRNTLVISLGLHIYVYSEFFFLSIGKEGNLVIGLSSKYANATCGLCGDFNSDPADDLTANGTREHLTPEQFGKAWRSGQNHWCVEGCLGGSCPNCSSEALERFSDPAACGKILEVNGPFRHCHSEVDPSSFYKSCISDLCLYGDVQPAVCRSLAEYADVCLRHKALVDAWRSPEFCYEACPSSTSYNMSTSPIVVCLGVLNLTIELGPNSGENCLCEAGLVHSGRHCVHPADCGCFDVNFGYILLGQEKSSCEQSCLCHPGGNLTCVIVSCSQDEECALIGGIQRCQPKAKLANCYINGSQLNTFDGQLFEFHSSCNHTLVQTCKDLSVEPLLIAVNGNGEGKQIYLKVNHMTFKMSTAHPEKIQVDQVYKNLPFSGNNVTVRQKNDWWTIKAARLVEITSDLHNYVEVRLPNAYHQTLCGLCGNYNDDPSDDMQLPNGTAVSDPDIFGRSWALSSSDSSCNKTCDSTCQRCRSSMPEYTSDLYCGLLTRPKGPFSSCHNSTCPEKYYSLCLNKLCVADGQKQALCDVLQVYEAACNVAGVNVDPWRNITGCALKCPQFSNFSQCANICSSLCPEIRLATQCPRHCEEGCQCDADHLYDGHACVPPEQCGCVHEGRMIKATESKLLQNCTLNCTCGPPLVCVEHKCPSLHRCIVLDEMAGCHKDDPCEGKCDKSERCHLSNGVAVCESRPGLCWTWGSRHYHTFDGLNYDVQGTCTYLLSGSKGAAGGVTPFMVSKKSDCKEVSSMQLVTVQAYGFVVKFIDKDSVHVNGKVNYIPVALLRGKIEVSNKEGKTLLETDFGLHVLFDWNTTILITLDPNYKEIVYGLCGNFNGDPQDDFAIHLDGFPPVNTSVELARAYRVFDGDKNCCTGCEKNQLDNTTLLEDMPKGINVSHKSYCGDLIDPTGPFAHCYSHVNPGSFYQSCIADLMQGKPEASLEQITSSYSVVCEQLNDYFPPELIIDVKCPPNSHYKTCGSACPPNCEVEDRLCHQACVQGCFCDPGFISGPEGCVPPQQCGCTDSKGKYHPVNSIFWIPDDCGQLCICKPGETRCRPSQCPEGMSCKQLPNKRRVCQTDKPLNCSIVTGLHFTSFDGHHFDFRDSCAYILVQTNANINGLQPFNITISDASCHKRLFYSLTLTLSIYNLKIVVDKEDPGKVNGLHRILPSSHHPGHFNTYQTPSSLVIHVDMGLQVIVYKTGTVMVVLPSSYESAVRGLCGNANSDPYDDRIMPDGTMAQNTLQFAHSWRLGGPMACRSRCTSKPKICPADLQKRFEGTEFCGVLTDQRGPFAQCALVLSPKMYYHNCLEDTCFYGGHYLALCNSIAAYAAACQAAQLPIGHWRADTFCGMICPKNSHYELCRPRCPVACDGISSATKCSGGCEEGCQCGPGYVLSNDRCVLVADCGCFYEGEYHPAGYFSDTRRCLVCYCQRGKVSCKPTLCMAPGREEFLLSDDPFEITPQQYGACEVFAGFGYVTFDGLVIPHYGACTYLVSECSPREMLGYSLLISFKKDIDSVFIVSKIAFILAAVEVTINPETPWKIQVNGEDFKVPYSNDILKAYEDGGRLTITSEAGVKLELSSTKYLRLSIPQDYNGTASGLCGNFNGDKSDHLKLRSGYPAKNITDFFHSWSIVSPGLNCSVSCGEDCGQCKLSSKVRKICDILLMANVEFSHCWSKGVKPEVYRDVCLRAICGGAAYIEAVCLTLEAYTAACRAKGVTVASWRENSPCSFKCPDHSSPSGCVDSNSNSCPALLHPGSSATGCSGGCQCQNGRVFDGGECVPVSQCGCVLHGRYIKLDEQLYSENCTERCWCHPLGGAVCEKATCNPGQVCSLKNGSWSCVGPEVCQLKGSLQLSTLNGQQLSLEPQTPYKLMGLCDKTAQNWFSLVSYHGHCEGSGTRLVTVIEVLLAGFSIVIQDGIVKGCRCHLSWPRTSLRCSCF
ncbi:IgGFc-binding protein-like isoform X2 [Vanacampus margaritifer]